ncbi:MAG: signal transduction histidine kinase [Bacteroidota bacterium]|jgi:signal transduction histidine kinase|nr:signal transduction histidine kinase [Bacteroidota bacterium]
MKPVFFLLYLILSITLSAQTPETDSLIRLEKKLRSRSGVLTTDTSLINCYLSLANEYYDLEERAKELENTNKSLVLIDRMMKEREYSGQIKKYLFIKQAAAYDNIASYYSDINNYPKAFEYYFKALQIDEAHDNPVGIKRHLINIAVTFGDQGEYEKCIAYNQRALKVSLQNNITDGMAYLYENIGSSNSSLRKYDSALYYYYKALNMYENSRDTLGLQTVFGNIASVYGGKGDRELDKGVPAKDIADYYTATVFYKKSLELFRSSGNKRMHTIQLSNYGAQCLKMGKFKEAEDLLKGALSISMELSDLYGIMETNQYLSELYEQTGDNKNAFRHYKEFIEAKDSIFNTENTKKNVQAEMNFEFDKKQAQKSMEHEKQVVALEAENRIQKNTRNFIIVLSFMTLLLVASGFVYFNNKRTLELRELHAQQLIIAQDKEKQRISKELHDSIGQNILFIKNQMIKNNELRLMSSVDETLEEVRNISKNLYPNQLEKYGLSAAVEALAEKTKQSSDIFVSCDLEGFRDSIPPGHQINYYRIIQECITNTVKHADATALRITATKKEGNIELIIQDDGKGFSKTALAKKAQQSFGMLNIEERIKSLKGRYELETSPGKGTKHIFIIPIQESSI